VGTIAADSTAKSSAECRWRSLELAGFVAALTGQDVSRVAGVSSGIVEASWHSTTASSLVLTASIDHVDVRFGDESYALVEPPARLNFARGQLVLAPVELEGDRNRFSIEGYLTRAGRIDFRLGLTEIDMRTLSGLASGGRAEIDGRVTGKLRLVGTLTDPLASGFLSATDLKWHDLAIDTAGARIGLATDTLRLTDVFCRLPSGEIRGDLFATAPAAGLPGRPGIDPQFEGRLSVNRARVDVPRWEGLRGGWVELSGDIAAEGTRLSDIASYEGVARVDCLLVAAPFGRTLKTEQSFLVRFGSGRRRLAKPVMLALGRNGADVGRIEVAHPGNRVASRLGVSAEHVSLDDLHHLLLPISRTFARGAVPDNMRGILDGRAMMYLREPARAEADVSIRDLAIYGLRADSLVARIEQDEKSFRLTTARLHSGRDTVLADGFVGLASDTSLWRISSRNIDLIEMALGLLPPLRKREPPPPLPSTMPMPGYPQQLRRLTPEARGDFVGAPLSVFDRLVARWDKRPAHDYAAMLPAEAQLRWWSGTSGSGMDGRVRIAGAYLELESLVEPVWFPDTLDVAFDGDRIRAGPHTIRIGSASDVASIDVASYSLDDGTFDLRGGTDGVTLTLVSAQPVMVPARFESVAPIIEPLLRSYYTEPIGTFVVEGNVRWSGQVDASEIAGDVGLGSSVLRYSVANPTDLLRQPAPTSRGTLLDNVSLRLAVATTDSLLIDNNLSGNARAWIGTSISGSLREPRMHGNVEISPGSIFRYLGRDFVVGNATILFRDPEKFKPELDVRSHTMIYVPDNDLTYRADVALSGTFPGRLATEMSAVAFDRSGAERDEYRLEGRRDVLVLILLGMAGESRSLDAQGRFSAYLLNRGYATLSSALTNVMPLDRVTVRQQKALARDREEGDESGLVDDPEVEVTQSFRLGGQRFTMTAATPVGRLSTLNPQRAELRWSILERPALWPGLESLSLTAGTQMGEGMLQHENTADIHLRIRFR